MRDPSPGQTLPTGTFTFLFTDIEGSTHLWESNPEAMQTALAHHDEVMKAVIESSNGKVVKTTGDGVHAVFITAMDALHAAVAAQVELRALAPVLPIKVRMGIHTGEAELRDGDYYGGTLNRAARIMSIGHGGQILLSGLTAQVARDHLSEGISLLDLGEHSLKGLNRAERIFQLNAPDLQKDFPPLNSRTQATDNLPTQLTSFIGRHRELAEAKSRLEGSRLLTLIGPGGTGKTRLSIHLGSELLSSFKDGVWLVELASISDASLVLQTVASVLDVREQPGMSLREQVLNYLRDKRMLLILDNCEHLIEICALLAEEFLVNAPEIKIIASSREALGITGETVYRVPSLTLPEQDQVQPGEALVYEAVRLFAERASAGNPAFHLTDENASAVVQICRRLDGIPLAIELAASRVRLFSPEEIAARLGDRFKLLTGGSRTALPRQQTLRSLIDWSYDILSTEEQDLFRRLSVFAGSFTFDAAETVCGGEGFLDLLTQLINKSLVVSEEGKETRYRLLETIRQYTRDKLLESGEGKEFRNKHLCFFLELVETAEPHLLGPEAVQWMAKLRAEHDNLRAALEWGISEDPEAALRMVGALPFFWILQGFAVEGRRWVSLALKQAGSSSIEDTKLDGGQLISRANAWLGQTIIATDLGDNRSAVASARASVEFARRAGHKPVQSLALAYLASAHANLGNPEDAYRLAQEALDVAQDSGHRYALGFALSTMGEVTAIARQDYENAVAYAGQAIPLTEEGGHLWGNSMILLGLGYMARNQRDYEKAYQYFEASLPVFSEIGDKHRVNMVQSELAHIAREQGYYREAVRAYRETILEWQRLGHRAAIAHQLECFAFIAKVEEQVARASRLLGAAEALRERINIAMTPPERIVYDREMEDLKSNMSPGEFAASWSDGRAMDMERAIEFALEEMSG